MLKASESGCQVITGKAGTKESSLIQLIISDWNWCLISVPMGHSSSLWILLSSCWQKSQRPEAWVSHFCFCEAIWYPPAISLIKSQRCGCDSANLLKVATVSSLSMWSNIYASAAAGPCTCCRVPRKLARILKKTLWSKDGCLVRNDLIVIKALNSNQNSWIKNATFGASKCYGRWEVVAVTEQSFSCFWP